MEFAFPILQTGKKLSSTVLATISPATLSLVRDTLGGSIPRSGVVDRVGAHTAKLYSRPYGDLDNTNKNATQEPNTTSTTTTTSLTYDYVCGRSKLVIPLTFLGSNMEDAPDARDRTFLVHSPGLPGAFSVPLSELARHAKQFHTPAHFPSSSATRNAANATSNEDMEEDEDDDLGMSDDFFLSCTCVMEALQWGERDVDLVDAKRRGEEFGVLDHLLRVGRRRAASLEGLESQLAARELINPAALRLDFPYHCGGSKAQAVKRYLDISHEVCSLFGDRVVHGEKVLTPFGIAVCVGVGLDDAPHLMQGGAGGGNGSPAVFWNPCGSPAACQAPLMHAGRCLSVGRLKLDYNGPLPTSDLTLMVEEVDRYVNPVLDGVYDTSTWLTAGLFGVHPGETFKSRTSGGGGGGGVDGDEVVVGVLFNPTHRQLELHVQNRKSGSIRCVDDGELPL